MAAASLPIADEGQPATEAASSAIGIYVHIPFCVRKCYYCDFNAGPASNAVRDRYVAALCEEIRQSTQEPRRPEGGGLAGCGRRAATVFFGGGTPSELNASQLHAIVAAVEKTFPPLPDAEWTLEANPGTVTLESLRAIRELGFNRISLGVQSFHDVHLKALGRVHTAAEAIEAFHWAGEAGFANRNVDLIFGLPRQTLSEWRLDLERAIALGAEHLSLYGLTIEAGTLFGRWHAAGRLPLPDEELTAAMYEHALDALAAAGYEQYEISNWALPGHRCRHNLRYWRNEEYLGFGVSAASYVDGARWTNVADWREYEKRVAAGRPCAEAAERLESVRAAGEAVMLALRMRDGADLEELSARYQTDLCQEFAAPIARLTRYGLLEQHEGRLRLTRAGLLLADRVLCEFV